MNLVQEMGSLLSHLKKSPQQYPAIEKLMVSANQIREETFVEDEKKYQPQKPLITIRQEKLETYIRLLFNLAMHFDIPKKWSVPFNFKWGGNISYSKFTNANFYYEIACVFYNYAVMYFNQGLQLMADPSQVKANIRYFRLAMWGFEQAEKATARCVSTGNVVPELTGANIQSSKAIATAFAYRVMYQALREKFPTFTIEQRTSFHKNSYQEAFRASALLEKANGEQFVEKQKIRKQIGSFKIMHICSILLEKAKEYGALHQEELSRGHIGVQIAFIENMKEMRGELKEAAEWTKDAEIVELLKAVDAQITQLPKLQLENKEVYKAAVPARDKLPAIPESEFKITPVEQPNVKTLLDDIPAEFKSSLFNQVESNFGLLISKNKDSLNAAFEGLSKRKLEIYQKHNVNALVRMAGGTDEELEQKVKQITQTFGGYQGYAKQLAQLNKSLQENDVQTRAIVSMIEKDDFEDQTFYQSYGIRVLGLKDPSNPFMKNFERHGIALTSLKQRDKDLTKEFERLTPILNKLDQGTFLSEVQGLKSQVTSSEDMKNLLAKVNGLEEMLKTHIEPQREQILQELRFSTSPASIQQIFFLNKCADDTYTALNEEMQTKVEDFLNKNEKVGKVVDVIGQLAAKVNSTTQLDDGKLNLQQKALTDVNNAILLYQAVANDLEMHDNVRKNCLVMNQLLDDYMISKKMQKQEIMNNINAFRNMGQFFENMLENHIVNNPYFRRF